MARQEFVDLQESGLLRDVEEIVVDGHRRLHRLARRPWSAPDAYRWLRYEDPDPVARLASGVRRLRWRGVSFGAEAVEKTCARAAKLGYLN